MGGGNNSPIDSSADYNLGLSNQETLDQPLGTPGVTPVDAGSHPNPKGFRTPDVGIADFPGHVSVSGGFAVHTPTLSSVAQGMTGDVSTLSTGQDAFEAGWALAGAAGDQWETVANMSLNSFNAGQAVSTILQQLSAVYEAATTNVHTNLQGYLDADDDSTAAVKKAAG